MTSTEINQPWKYGFAMEMEISFIPQQGAVKLREQLPNRRPRRTQDYKPDDFCRSASGRGFNVTIGIYSYNLLSTSSRSGLFSPELFILKRYMC
jgi:hypothetical protein